MGAAKKKTNRSKDTLWVKVYLVYAFFLVFALAVVIRMAVVMFVEGKELLARSEEQSLRYEEVKAVRGNIYSANGSLLAASVPVFEIRMDLSPKVVPADTFRRYLRPLCDSLHAMYPQTSAAAYRRNLEKARRDGSRNHLIKRRISYDELQRMQKFPLFNKGQFKGGFIVTESERRSQPHSPLARRTIGSYNAATGYGAGLEKAFNTDLEGQSGRRLTQRVAKGVWRPIYNEETIEPRNGKDLITTIDTRIQDVAHAALERCVRENEADHGCAVLMEVATGRIVAIANLTRQPDGSYTEQINYVVGESVEPGSTFKLASAIAILEEGRFDTATLVPTGIMEFYGKRMIDSHRAGYGDISFQEAFEKSSNVGISYLAHETFLKNPQKFVEYLYGMRLNEITGIEIPGEGRPYIKNPKDKSWSKLSLPWMSIGYEVQLTPLQILSLYNAVANDGKMMKPQLVDEIRSGGKTVKKFEPVVLKERIASKKTLDKARGMLENVVQHGTGRSLSKSPYKIAGKTGTAQINYARRDGSKMLYRASFAGYFPADKPLYSCMIMITEPHQRRVYGSDLAAPVFKEIADKVYATLLKDRPEGGLNIAELAAQGRYPSGAAGYGGDLQRTFAALGLPTGEIEETAFVRMTTGSDGASGDYRVRIVDRLKDVMPDVRGLGARDAVYILEKQGLRVQVSGSGRVKRQSVEAGQPIRKNDKVWLELN